MNKRRDKWSLGWGARHGAAVGAVLGALSFGVLVVVDGAATGRPVDGWYLYLLIATGVGAIVGVTAGFVGSLAARTAHRLNQPGVPLGALAAGIAVGVGLLPLTRMWDLALLAVLVVSVVGALVAAWQLFSATAT